MPNATWKDVERRTAKALGGIRVGPVGYQSPDVLTDWLAIECKHRQTLPRWLLDAVNKIRWQAKPHRLGIVVVHGKGQRDSLVVMSLADFREWFADLGSIANIPEG
jgi:hypothetical protein